MFDPSGYRDLADYLEQFLNEVESFRGRLSELVAASRQGYGEQSEMAARANGAMGDHLLNVSAAMVDMSMAAVSSTQTQTSVCQLPYHNNPTHIFYSGRNCTKDPAHEFCKSHKLSYCVICGGTLK